MDNKTIINNFSRYAHLYDKYARVQRDAASGLLAHIDTNGFKDILEIGCGTGNYTLALRSKFKAANITALDLSDRMISIAKNKINDEKISFIIADAENMSLPGRFDLVTSNASFQWFRDLNGSLKNYKALLNNSGRILFSMFGRGTFPELGVSLKDILGNSAIPAAGFPDPEDIKAALREHFSNVKIKEVEFKESFGSLEELLRKIKYSGIRGNGLNGQAVFTASLLSKLEDSYMRRFKRIEATYQVFLCLGEK